MYSILKLLLPLNNSGLKKNLETWDMQCYLSRGRGKVVVVVADTIALTFYMELISLISIKKLANRYAFLQNLPFLLKRCIQTYYNRNIRRWISMLSASF